MRRRADLKADLSDEARNISAPLAAASTDGRILAAVSVDAARGGEVFTFRNFEGAFDFLQNAADRHDDWIGWEHLTVELRCGARRLFVECPARLEDPFGR